MPYIYGVLALQIYSKRREETRENDVRIDKRFYKS